MKKSAFLVYDKSLMDLDNCPFFTWLKEEGFQSDVTYDSRKYPHRGTPWVHVDIGRRVYAWGMFGVELFIPIGGHALTVEEFKTVYGVYKKYAGKELFEF